MTFQTATSKDDVLCLVIKLVNKCDNGPEYRSDAFTEFLSKGPIQHHATPVYHPQSKGKVEVFNHSLTFHAQAMATSNTPFAAVITELLARFRAEHPSPETLLPAEIMFNQHAHLPFEPRQSISEPAIPQLKKARQNVHFEEKHRPKQQKPPHRNPLFNIGDKVPVR
uniref:Integrase catalytic domain-containing protein n=1 Tax=Romanomermis culicivorax TaxID=13658 RepID=A0A915J8Y0_ROMCU